MKQELEQLLGAPRMPGRSSRLIYILSAGDKIKIGISDAPERRLIEVSRQSGDELELVAWFDGTFEDERKIHRMLHYSRLRGEWFAMTGEVTDFIVQSMLRCISAILNRCTPSERQSLKPKILAHLNSLADQFDHD